MSPRAWEIFRLLMKDPFGTTTVRQLALDLDVSERTIRYDLAMLSSFLEEHGIVLQRVPHKGISIGSDDVAAALDLLQEQGGMADCSYLPADEREHAITAALLDGTCPRTLGEIADEFGVSRSTAKRDFDRAAEWLAQHGAAVRYDLQMGWLLETDEYSRRRAMVDFVEELFGGSGDVLASFKHERSPFPFRALLRASDLEAAASKLSALCVRHGEQLTDEAYRFLVHYLCVSISRMRGGHFVKQGTSEGLPSAWHEDVCRMLSELCPRIPSSHLSEEAMVVDALLVASPRQSLPAAESKRPELASRITEDFLGRISKSLGFDLFSDGELVQAMTIHAKAMIARAKLGIVARNPLLDQIKTQFNELYRECSAVLEETLLPYGLSASDDEASYFATYVGAALERFKERPIVRRKTRVAVVCGAGVGTASFLSRALANEYPHMEVAVLLSARECRSYDYAGIDLVLSTVDVPFVLPRPVLRVSPMLTRSDVRLIDSFLNPSAAGSNAALGTVLEIVEKTCDIKDRDTLERELGALLTPSPAPGLPKPEGFMSLVQLMERGEIQTGIRAKSWEDAVWRAARPLLDDGRMSETYIQQVFDLANEYEQYGVILAPLCAPHAEPDASNKASISVVTLAEDVMVSMGGDDVRLNVIMLLCLQTPVAHAVALDELFSLVDEYPAFIADVHDAHTPAEVLGITERYLKSMLHQMPAGFETHPM